ELAWGGGEPAMERPSSVDPLIGARREQVGALKGNCAPLFTPTPLGPLHDVARQVGGSLPAQLESPTARADLFAGILDRLRKSLKPVVLVIEDLHWADEATLDLIKYLSRRVSQVKVLLVVTYRDDEVAGRPGGGRPAAQAPAGRSRGLQGHRAHRPAAAVNRGGAHAGRRTAARSGGGAAPNRGQSVLRHRSAFERHGGPAGDGARCGAG